MSFLQSYRNSAYTLVRIVAGLLFMIHGLQKVFGVLGGQQPPLWTQIWVGGVIELVCGALIAVGFLTRLSAFLASGTMAVAYVQFHWKLQLGAGFFPVVNQGELALLYSVLFLYVACAGGGRYAVDALLRPPAPEPAASDRQRLSA
jgi:putative oxidoreductase